MSELCVSCRTLKRGSKTRRPDSMWTKKHSSSQCYARTAPLGVTAHYGLPLLYRNHIGQKWYMLEAPSGTAYAIIISEKTAGRYSEADLHIHLTLTEIQETLILWVYEALTLIKLALMWSDDRIHERFIDKVEDAIRVQLRAICNRPGKNAQFAQKAQPERSTKIQFAPPSSKSKYETDASFSHDDAQYPGVIIEVAYSQKKKRLGRVAKNYLLDSDANVRAVVGLDIEYGKKGSRKATISIWRPQFFYTANGSELRAVQEVVDEAFRDDEGNPVNNSSLQLRLSDFTHEKLARDEMEDEDTEICISGIQLCEYLAAAESKARRAHTLSKQSLPYEVKKMRRSETPPEES